MAKTLIGNVKGPKGDTGAQGETGPQGTAGATGTRGSRWSEGTAITGTSTTATIFSGTGIADALVNDHYMNTSTGNVYRCTTAGNASTAKWVYVGNIRGPQGPKGDTGATGATGATGPQGPKGEKGEPGETPALISTYADMMASTVSGYVPDALAVKEGFNTINSNLEKHKNAHIIEFEYTEAKTYDCNRDLTQYQNVQILLYNSNRYMIGELIIDSAYLLESPRVYIPTIASTNVENDNQMYATLIQLQADKRNLYVSGNNSIKKVAVIGCN